MAIPKRLPATSPQRILTGLAAFVIVIAGMKAAQSIVVLFLMSIFIAVICGPLVCYLTRYRFPDWVAISLVIISVVLFLLGLGVVAGASINEFSNAIPSYQDKLEEKLAQAIPWLGQYGIKTEGLGGLMQTDAGSVLKLVGNIVNQLGQLLSNSILILLIVSFMLFEASTFPDKLRAIASDPDQASKQLDLFLSNMNRYVAIKTLISLATGVLVTIGTASMGLDYVLVWGMLAFLLNFIPTIGSIIAAIPAVLFSLVELSFGHAAVVTIFYITVNTVVGNMIEPRFMGKGLGLSPLVVFLSLLFWGWVLGPLGMLLSVPLTMTIKLAADAHPDSQWLAVFLGGAPKKTS